ncbi:MAG: adenine deaminase [Gemmatimonadetes bacterium]|nr:adenine deaminase [Gemmatimonadota bacterium]
MTRRELIEVARGDRPADLGLFNGRVVNVFTGELEEVAVAVAGEWIAGLGARYRAERTLDLGGRYVCPGFIDAHVHIESSLAVPREFARAVVPRGTTTVVSDPHEIANVHGLAGIEYMLDASQGLPLSVFVMASSCVPATPMGTAGARLGPDELAALRGRDRVLGLAEVMNFPGVIAGDPEIWAKLEAFRGKAVDGHAPGLRGAALNAYVAAGPGSDHESTAVDEALEKLRRGLTVFLREATNARNLRALAPVLCGSSARRCALCTDDRQPPDLLDEGGIDHMVRILIEEGVEPLEALRAATLNAAEYFGLHDRGAVAPGRRADLVVFSDLRRPEAELVFAGGRMVAEGGAATDWPVAPRATALPPSVRIDWSSVRLAIPARSGSVRVIRAIPDQIVTGHELDTPLLHDGEVVADPARDLLKIAVIERHTGRSGTGLGLVRGMGLRRGAIAGTVAHDHHNLIVIGADDTSMVAAARAVADMQGGLAAAQGERVIASLALPVAGLMSAEPIAEIRTRLEGAVAAARSLGSPLHDPFMAMSFLGLEVIPALKLTDQGLVDVEQFRIVDLWV